MLYNQNNPLGITAPPNVTHWVLLWASPPLKTHFSNWALILQTGKRNIAEIKDQDPRSPHDFTSQILKVHHENLKSSRVSCTTLFPFFFFFSSHTGEKQSVFKGSIDEIFKSTSQKRVQETPPKSKPQLIKGDKKGSGEGEGRWKLRGGGGLGSHLPREYIPWWNLQYDTPSLAVTHTHAHTLADTHTFSFHAEAGTHTPNTHTHTNPVWWKLPVVTSNRCSVLQMVWSRLPFPRSVEDQKSIQKSRGRRRGQPGPGRPRIPLPR